MPIAPHCHMCGEQLDDYGALAFSPPDHYEDCHKYHICRRCWPQVQKALDGNDWISVNEALPLDEYAENDMILAEVLVCGAWDEDEPPPNSYTTLVDYSGSHGWVYHNKTTTPWPCADKITHWMYMPDPHPASGDKSQSEPRAWGTISYAERAVANSARDLRAFAAMVAPKDDSPPCLVELRSAMEHMAHELECRHEALEFVKNADCEGCSDD